MQLSESQVAKIANLARIGMHDQEAEDYAKDLSAILEWVEQLAEIDTKGVSLMTSVVELGLPWREDVSEEMVQQDVLDNAPDAAYGCFSVPKVVE